jgi:imidazolonepropionase-like amidohydrolase
MTTTIIGGTLFDAVAGAFRPNPGIVIDGGKIARVGDVDARRAAEGGGSVVDATGKTVTPGLMNLHGHLAWDAFSDLEAQCRYDGPMGYVKAARGLISAVEAGVTTFRDLACVHDTGLVARQAQRDGLIAGPKVIACGRAVCRTGGHIWFGNREADGVDEVRKATREQIKAGADWIKLMAHGYSYAEIEACITQAHDLGVPVTTDAGTWAEAAVDAGVDCIEHGGDYSDALIAKIVEKGVWIVPTLSPVVLQARDGHAWGMKQSVIDRRKAQLADGGRHHGLVRARQAGAKLAFGTDSGSPVVPHGAVLAEMEQLLAFGIFETPVQVLQAATIRAAELIRQEGRTGSLEAGKAADVVILDGDLSRDLRVVERVESVWVDGRLTVSGGAAKLPDPRDFRTFANVGA